MMMYRSRRLNVNLKALNAVPREAAAFRRAKIVGAYIMESWRAVLRDGCRPHQTYLHAGQIFRRPSIDPKRTAHLVSPARRIIPHDRFAIAVRLADRAGRRVARINARRS